MNQTNNYLLKLVNPNTTINGVPSLFYETDPQETPLEIVIEVENIHDKTLYLKELKTNGKTIIISTHIFEVVEKVADRVGIVINGKLEYEDSISRIKKEKSLEDVFFEVYYSKEGEH